MFAKSSAGTQPNTGYKLVDRMQGDRPAIPALRKTAAAFGKLGLFEKAFAPRSEKAAIALDTLDPAMRSNIIAANMRAQNGMPPTNDDRQLCDMIVAMQESGELSPTVCATLLRLMDPPDPENGFVARRISPFEATEGASGEGGRYPADAPSPGKSAEVEWAYTQALKFLRGDMTFKSVRDAIAVQPKSAIATSRHAKRSDVWAQLDRHILEHRRFAR